MGKGLWLLCLGFVMAGLGCDRRPSAQTSAEDTERSPVLVESNRARRGVVHRFVPSSGNLEAHRQATLVAEDAGPVLETPFAEGDSILSGDLLVLLHPRDRVLQLERARWVARRDSAELARSRTLFERSLISLEVFEQARVASAISKTDLEVASHALERTQIGAPFDGVVAELFVRPGQVAALGAPVVSVVDADPLRLLLYLPEDDLADLAPGQVVDVQSQGRADPIRGEVVRISPVVDAVTGTVKVEASLPNPGGVVRPGAFVRARLITEVREDVVLAPINAVLYEGRTSFVFCLEAGMAKRVSVTLGLEEEGWVEVTSGLIGGEELVVAGQGALREGDPVRLAGGEPAGS